MGQCEAGTAPLLMSSSADNEIPALERVMVIDDDPISLSLTALLLEAEGVEVEPCSSGENACTASLPGGWEPDLILADLRMPGLHGSALAERLARRWPRAHRIAMSAAAPEAIEGYAAVLQKPLPMDGLRALLEEICLDGLNTDGLNTDSETEQLRSDGHATDESPVLDKEVFAKLERSMPPAALQEFLKVMLTDGGNRIEGIRAALNSGDMTGAKREAHTLRGSAGMAGAAALKKIAQQIETEVDSLDDLKRHFARLRTEHERLSVILASKLP